MSHPNLIDLAARGAMADEKPKQKWVKKGKSKAKADGKSDKAASPMRRLYDRKKGS